MEGIQKEALIAPVEDEGGAGQLLQGKTPAGDAGAGNRDHGFLTEKLVIQIVQLQGGAHHGNINDPVPQQICQGVGGAVVDLKGHLRALLHEGGNYWQNGTYGGGGHAQAQNLTLADLADLQLGGVRKLQQLLRALVQELSGLRHGDALAAALE